MELKPEHILKFKLLHKGTDFDKYTEEQINEIANGVINYYLTLFKIHQRIKKDSNENGLIPSG